MSKKILAIIGSFCFLGLFLTACQAETAGPTEEKIYPYGFDTAKVTYEMKGSITGQKTVYYKGNKSSTETHASRNNAGVEEKMDMLTIDSGEFIYQIDLNTLTGTNAKNPVYSELKGLSGAARAEYLTRIAVGGAPGSTQQPVSKEQKEIAGQKCDLYQVADLGEVCLWSGIPLYTKIELPDAGISNTVTATAVQINLDVSDQKFVIPNGIKMQDVSR